MALTYSSYVTSLANIMVIEATNTAFLIDLPNIILDAELRAYRDLDLLNTVVRDSSAATVTSTPLFNLPSSNGTFVVVGSINIITPAGTSDPNAGTRNPVTPASKEMIQALFPSATGSSVPEFFGMVSQSTVIFGPWPAASYQVEVTGTIRPGTLSSTNTTTLLSVYFDDLFLSASMVRAAAYLKNYGAAVDDPRQAMTWESHYATQLASAQVEEARKKFTGQGWSSKQPAPIATPPRT